MPSGERVQIRLASEPLDVQEILAHMGSPGDGEGATVVFVGTVRADHQDGAKVVGIFYDAYGPMAEKQARALADEALERFGLTRIRVDHRVGYVAVGEPAFVVVIRAAHRKEAFEAMDWFTDAFKRQVPLWKKEHFSDGKARWKSEEDTHD